MPRFDLFPGQPTASRAYCTLAGDIASRPAGNAGDTFAIEAVIGGRRVFAVADSEKDVQRYLDAAGQQGSRVRRHTSRRAAWQFLHAYAQQPATRAYLFRCALNAEEYAVNREGCCQRFAGYCIIA